ncbi:MAG TPA: glycerate kinase [Anaerolineales bacterium]|nr:glycerate kinase [Anaerolineales bacterium]
MELDRFATHSLKEPRLLRILSAALEAVDPFRAVQKHLPDIQGRVYGLGIGKAAIPMMDALAERILLAGGLAVTKFAAGLSRKLYTVLEGGHPIPDVRSLQAGERVLDFVSSLEEEDTLVCLISGGGSALVTAPYEGISLEDMQSLTSLLLSSGARIDEINTLRRQLDRIKGGGLARATNAKVISLILSDVIGNPLEAIASGPTASNPTTREDALKILKKYEIEKQVPNSITDILLRAPSLALFTPRVTARDGGGSIVEQVQNIIIGDNKLAAQAAFNQAEREGFYAEILTNELQGEARDVGQELARRLRVSISEKPHSLCLIAGGETTVIIQGNGKGGRNQEVALAAVEGLAGLENVMLISLATDGDDGPTDAAGAVVTGETARRAELLGMRADDHLSRNDAYSFFEALGDLLKTGPTGTNVNDLMFLCCV